MDVSQLKQEYRDLKRLTEQAVKSIFPIKGNKRSLELENVWSEEKLGFEDYGSQAKTKDKQGTWGEPIYADLRLVDNRSGHVLDRAKKVRLFNIPKMTDRSSYIVKGNEYQVHKQLRLKPGAYTVKKRNGELKTQFNLGRGKNFDIIFDDNSGRFFLSKIGGKAAKVPLYPVLQDLGISHAGIAKAWGQKLADMNRVQDPKAIAKAKELFAAKGSLKEYFDKTEIDKGTTKDLLGTGYSKVQGQTLLDASRNLLHTHQEKREPDDRDSLQFKELWSTEDFIKERLEKNKFDIARKIRRTLNNERRTTIDKIVNPTAFSSTVESFFTTDDKSSAIEQLNPLQMLAGMNKVTIMGAGGVGSDRAVTNEMRNIHPSHFGFIDPIHTPESERIGANLNLPLGTIKSGNDIKKVVKDKSGQNVTLSVKDAFNSYIAFPDQKGQKVKALYKGKMVEVDKSKIQYFTPDPSALFSWSSNLIPFLPSNQGNRAMMASKMMEQAIALKNREAPLVQVGTAKANGDSFEQVLGKEMSKKSPVDGIVTKVTKDEVSIKSGNKTTKVPLYNNFSLNRETFLNHELKVKVGDKVSTGQILADSNYTKDGTLALGTNLRAAYVPYKGLTFEDGIVITESGAKKLTSEHIRKKQVDRDENTVFNRSKFKLMYPNRMTAQNLEKLDSDGILKVGSTVKMGDVVIAALRNRDISKKTAVLSKTLSQRPKDISVSWNYEDDGKVTKVVNNASGVTVFIKTEEQAKIGDKLAGRFGNKGIVTKIIPDEQAPHDSKGNAIDIMLNPHGVISRINIGQIYESAAGKAALKTGKPVKVHNFKEKDYKKHAERILREAKVADKEELINPETGKSMGKVHVGNPYMLKLFKQSTSNFSARQGGPGTPYDINLQPLKAGGEEGSKALDVLTFYSMLSHGARANLQEMATLKSSKNDEYWKALKSGQLMPPPKESFAYDKFTKYLAGAGIDLRKDGSKITLAPLTDKQVGQMSNGKVTTPKLFKAKNMKPEKGGIFDSVKFGGFSGEKWGHMELKEAAVNPVFEKAARSVLDIKKQYDGIIDGKLHVDEQGNINKQEKGVTGGAAIERLLKKVNVDAEVKQLTSQALKQTGDTLDRTNKRLRYLSALQKFNLKPEEAYIRKKVPIIPPKYRPLYNLPDGNIGTSDINVLYQNVGILNEMMGKPVMDLLPEDEKAVIRKDMQNHLDGVSGITDLNIKGRERQGFISEIKGGRGAEGQPKEGYFISKLLSKKQDFTGRGAIIPEPEFGVDEMGMPEKMAWKLFEPFVVKELRNHGKTPNAALDEIKNKTELARKALDIVMKDRKVLLNRAPSLHKFSVMAFKPKVVSGKAIKIPPLVVDGFNADFNGDSCDITTVFHVRYRDNLDDPDANWTYFSLKAGELFEMVLGISIKEMILEARHYTGIYEIEKGKLQTMSIYNEVPQWVDIQRLTVHTSHGPCYEVKTHTGTKVIVTEHHNFSYINNNFELVCTKTDVMPLDVLIPKSVPGIYKEEKHYIDAKSKRILIDEEIAWLLGFYAGDGSVSHDTVSFCDTEKCVIDKIVDILRRRFRYGRKLQGTKSAKNCIVRIYDKDYSTWFEDVCGKGFAGKIIPTQIFNSSASVRKAYITGVFQAEGSIGPDAFGNYMARIEMVNHAYIESLRFLMSTVGVDTYIQEAKHKGRGTGHLLRLRKDSMPELNELIGKKLKALETATNHRATRIQKDKFDIVPISPELIMEMATIGHKMKRLSRDSKTIRDKWRQLHPGRKVSISDHTKNNQRFVSRHIAKDLIHTYGAFGSSYFRKWMEIVKREDLMWERVISIKEVNRREVMFDFTVPQGQMFLIQNGIFTHNTMTVHVPVSDEANKEAEMMMPSRNLFQPGTGKLMIKPSQEAQLGLFHMSKTPQGRSEINKVLGKLGKVENALSKSETSKLLKNIAKKASPEDYAKTVHRLKEIGENHTYATGFSLGMEDITTMGSARDKIVSLANRKIAKAKTQGELGKINKDMNDVIDKFLANRIKGKGNALYDMVESGARGNNSQLRQILATPMLVQDAKGKIVPRAISKSYAEGLDSADYWTSLYGARKGMMDRAIQTSVPGAFSKDIMSNTIDNVISAEDCGTKKGKIYQVSNQDAIGRYLAKDHGAMPRNTFVDANTANILKQQGIGTLEVRTPLRCLQKKGTCAYCYGVDEHGEKPSVGDNVGTKAGQTLSEPLLQMVMNTFHTGGAAGTGADAAGFDRIDQLLQLKKVIPNAAPLATRSGRVSKIEKAPQGGYYISIDGKKPIYSPKNNPLKVKVGSTVNAGDPLAEGVIKPQELVKYKGMEKAQEYITDELKKAYDGQGVKIDRKVFETVVRSFGNTTKVLNNPKDTSFLPGDVVPYTVVNAYNSNLVKDLPINDTEGMKLAKPYLGLKKGHTIEKRDIDQLRQLGHATLSIELDRIKHAPFLKGMQQLPMLRKDWMAALGYRQLAKTLTEGAGQAWSTDLQGHHPVPAFAFGANFGKGKDGKY